MEALVMGILLDMIFFSKISIHKKPNSIKTQMASQNGNDRRYTSEFIYGYRGHKLCLQCNK
mgnify:CR=1 FL=1